MFVLAAGATWVDGIPLVEEDGSANARFCLFFIAFTLLVTWVNIASPRCAGHTRCCMVHLPLPKTDFFCQLVLKCSVVVLIDNFVRATAAVEHEQARTSPFTLNVCNVYMLPVCLDACLCRALILCQNC